MSRDMSDTQSWTNLGNAYMSYFFASSLDREDLLRALKAYHRSDLDGQSLVIASHLSLTLLAAVWATGGSMLGRALVMAALVHVSTLCTQWWAM